MKPARKQTFEQILKFESEKAALLFYMKNSIITGALCMYAYIWESEKKGCCHRSDDQINIFASSPAPI